MFPCALRRPMTLLIDIGNTALKWAFTDARSEPAEVHVELHHDADNLAVKLSSAWASMPSGLPAVGCSVAASPVRAAVERAAKARGATVQWLGAEPRHDGAVVLVNGYRNPAQLGADRWHGMLGACLRCPGHSFVLVAAGTATTVDCVQRGPDVAGFIGGCIAPGARMMFEALARRTAGLPQARGAATDFPDNTDDAITTGVVDAQAGLAGQIVQRFARRLGHAPAILVSGGDAEAVADRLRTSGLSVVIEHNLVLAGLALRARVSNSTMDR
jgi:type III pantothenate kinase